MARVLVVDDAPDLSDVVARLLRRAGHEVSTAEDGEAALAALAAGPRPAGFDVALLDVMMPGADGFDVLRAVRADPRTAGLPVVVFSAVCDARYRRRAAELGADGYLVKGRTTYEELAEAVARHAGDGPVGA